MHPSGAGNVTCSMAKSPGPMRSRIGDFMRSCLRHCYRLLYLRMIIVLCSIFEAAGTAQSPPTLGICSGPPWNRMKQPQFSKSTCLALPNNPPERRLLNGSLAAWSNEQQPPPDVQGLGWLAGYQRHLCAKRCSNFRLHTLRKLCTYRLLAALPARERQMSPIAVLPLRRLPEVADCHSPPLSQAAPKTSALMR